MHIDRISSDDQYRRAVVFRDLHAADGLFVMPNPWDAASAKVLAGLGFPALATTSAGVAYTVGRPDGASQVSRDVALANARLVISGSNLPVSADLEYGFAEDLDGIAETFTLAADAGLVGGSIEDSTGRDDDPIRPLDEAAERVAAAVAAVRALPFPFTLTARAENFLHGRPDLDDTIARLRAFDEAGADVLFAPGLPDLDAVRAVVAAVRRPVSVIAAPQFTVAELAACGVRRVSVGSGFARATLGALVRAGREVAERGTFGYLADALTYQHANALMTGDESP
jgi:2-methylisocitrate lyase-like PEP mutase family enzyme